ncbi:MAG: class I SAM-dependent rRNA methyltransferase [Planctomycetaceae bacterium]|nr:class I SAM-dependent rRNA methyltransferase [Planctomycetaceae bacterium]
MSESFESASRPSRSSRPGKPPRGPARKPHGRSPERPRERRPEEGVSTRWAQRPLSPDPTAPLPAVFAKSVGRHPILYRKRIDRVDPGTRAGDLVAVYDLDERLMGYGLFNTKSEMAVRMVRFEPDLPDDAFWQERLENAVRLRREALRLDETANAYRVIHAEADGFPGLVVDRLGDVLSAEAFTPGMFQRGEEILSRLQPLCGTSHTVLRCSPQSESQEGFVAPPISSPQAPGRVTIQEFGTRFRVMFEGGHKTGFFCDQRDNRRLLAGFCRGKTVLDLCCYTGGFAVQAKVLGQAEEVTGVDLDESPLGLARENANLNQARVKFVQADAFGWMREALRHGKRYDVVVLDPPKLIRNRGELEEGTRRHFDLNRLAMQLVSPGGILLSCSCAGLLGEEEFVRLLCSAARQAGAPLEGTAEEGETMSRRHGPREMQILFRTGAAPDHPVSSECRETEYLKAVWMRLT